MKVKVSLWKYEFIGLIQALWRKYFFYSAQLVLKLVQGYQENDDIHRITRARDLVLIPQQTWYFSPHP